MKKNDTNLFNTYFKKVLNIILLLSFCSPVYSQYPTRASLKNQANINKSSNFYEIQKEMEDYWNSKSLNKSSVIDEDGEDGGAPGWSLYKRWEYYWEQRVNTKTGEFPKTNSVIEYQKYKASKNALSKTAYNESWTNLGTNSSNHGYYGIGRINCIAFHPTKPDTFWVGSPSGGIWKTTNGGSNWTILNNDQPVLGVSDIAIPSDYETSNTIYIATGDRDGGSMWSLGGGQAADNVSIGVLKSTDGGGSWLTTGLSFAKNLGKKVFSLLIHPSNNLILFAATSDGIYKTTDGGDNWTQKTPYRDWRLAFKPGDPNIMYGTEAYGGDQYFDRSTDGGKLGIQIFFMEAVLMLCVQNLLYVQVIPQWYIYFVPMVLVV